MAVKLFKHTHSKKGGSIEVQKENPNKFTDKASGIVGFNPTLNKLSVLPSVQSQKPTTATISYGGQLLKKINFNNKKDKDKFVKIKL